jgi:hypothetical protein
MFTTEKEFYDSLFYIFLIAIIICFLVGVLTNPSPLIEWIGGL